MSVIRSAEQDQFTAALHDLLSKSGVPEAARAWASGDHAPVREVWASLAGLGVPALLIPEQWSGIGAGLTDLVVACEELGHHAVPGPVAESYAAIPELLLALGDADLCAQWLPQLASGDVIATLAAPPQLPCAPDAGLAGLILLVDGEGAAAALPPGDNAAGAAPVPEASMAPGKGGAGFWTWEGGATGEGETSLWTWEGGAGPPSQGTSSPAASSPARGATRSSPTPDASSPGPGPGSSAPTLRLGTAGVRHQSVHPARWLFEVRAGDVLAEGPAVAAALRRAHLVGALATAAQLLGAGQAVLQASVRYAGQRVQFSRPIGAFQAVKHQLADVAIGLEFARPLLDAAAASLAESGLAGSGLAGSGLAGSGRTEPGLAGAAEASRDVSAAKVACGDAAYRAARVALQVHGAIGYTEEHDLSLWLTKIRALISAWGTQAQHRAAVLAALTSNKDSAGHDGVGTGRAGTSG